MCTWMTATANLAMSVQEHAEFLALPDERKRLVLKYRRANRRDYPGWKGALGWCRQQMTPEEIRIAEGK